MVAADPEVGSCLEAADAIAGATRAGVTTSGAEAVAADASAPAAPPAAAAVGVSAAPVALLLGSLKGAGGDMGLDARGWTSNVS